MSGLLLHLTSCSSDLDLAQFLVEHCKVSCAAACENPLCVGLPCTPAPFSHAHSTAATRSPPCLCSHCPMYSYTYI
jgi:hypothetical protein